MRPPFTPALPGWDGSGILPLHESRERTMLTHPVDRVLSSVTDARLPEWRSSCGGPLLGLELAWQWGPSRHSDLPRPGDGPAVSPPLAPDGPPEGGEGRRPACQVGQPPHASPPVRDALAGGRPRHSYRSGVPGHHDVSTTNLHARAESQAGGGAEPGKSDVHSVTGLPALASKRSGIGCKTTQAHALCAGRPIRRPNCS
jgi:hypothetical protein